MPYHLSAFDFQIAQNCAAKLYYKKLRYPSVMDENEEWRFMAEDGEMIDCLAKLLYPTGVQINRRISRQAAIEETQKALQAENVVLFGAKFATAHKRCTVDILIKSGNQLELIDARSKPYNSQKDQRRRAKGVNIFRSQKEGNPILSGWQKHIKEVAFQVDILQTLFPDVQIEPFLLLPDMCKPVSQTLLYSNFARQVYMKNGRPRLQLEFVGDAEKARDVNFLSKISIALEVAQVIDEVREEGDALVGHLQLPLQRANAPLGHHCKSCEYRIKAESDQNGFRECWNAFAQPSPHIFDMYRLDATFANTLIQQKRMALLNIKEAELVTIKGEIGKDHQRQRIQLKHTELNSEWISKELPLILPSFSYPLHFIDFEVSALAIPYHAGMFPYDPVAFQWSCHTIHEPDGKVMHSEWINSADKFPNYTFAETLMAQLGNTGTIFAWGTYENYLLSHLLERMDAHQVNHPKLKEWLEVTVKLNKKDVGRIEDMHKLTQAHHFHPLMKGRTSLKCVLDAIWKSNPALHTRFPAYLKKENNQLITPYQTLPPLLIDGQEIAVHNGAEVIRAYQAMLYGAGKQDLQVREQWKKLLLQYCKLDTLAMVMVWSHWWDRIGG